MVFFRVEDLAHVDGHLGLLVGRASSRMWLTTVPMPMVTLIFRFWARASSMLLAMR